MIYLEKFSLFYEMFKYDMYVHLGKIDAQI